MPRFRPRRELQEADRVEVVDRRRVREVAHLGRIAGDDDQVPDAERVRAEQVRDLAEQVPIAPAHVEDGLDAELALHAAPRSARLRHARLRARRRRRC